MFRFTLECFDTENNTVYGHTFGLISGFTLPVSHFLVTAMRAIFSQRFSDDDSLRFAVQKSSTIRLFYQVVASIFIQYSTRVFVLKDTIIFADIVRDGVQIYFNTLFFKAIFYCMDLVYSGLWEICKKYILPDLGEWNQNEFDYCWRLDVENEVCLFEIFERALITFGTLCVFLFIYSDNLSYEEFFLIFNYPSSSPHVENWLWSTYESYDKTSIKSIISSIIYTLVFTLSKGKIEVFKNNRK